MRVGLYARVSTSDKDQNPDTQLLPLVDTRTHKILNTFRTGHSPHGVFLT